MNTNQFFAIIISQDELQDIWIKNKQLKRYYINSAPQWFPPQFIPKVNIIQYEKRFQVLDWS